MRIRWLAISLLLCAACARQSQVPNAVNEAESHAVEPPSSRSPAPTEVEPREERTWDEIIAASALMELEIKSTLAEYGFKHAEQFDEHHEAASYTTVYTAASTGSDQLTKIRDRLLKVSNVYRYREERDGEITITCDPPYHPDLPEFRIIDTIRLIPDGRGAYVEEESGPQFAAISVFRTLWRKEWATDGGGTGG